MNNEWTPGRGAPSTWRAQSYYPALAAIINQHLVSLVDERELRRSQQ